MAALIGAIAWTAFYWTLGDHRIERLDELVRYLKGEDLYRKYEVSRITWDCPGLRRQFAATYIADRPDRMAIDGSILIFRQTNLDPAEFDAWIEGAQQQLAFGTIRKVESDGALLPALMVRLFTDFRFESGGHVETVRNEFGNKCRR